MNKSMLFNNQNHEKPEIFETVSMIKDANTPATLKLLEEQLSIYKNKIDIGEVSVRKEVVTEEKIFSVPVNREELVIERKATTESSQEEYNLPTEILRIPIKEEQVEIIKHQVVLEEVDVYNDKYEEIVHVEESLKKEKLNLKITGNPRIIDTVVEIE